jgi:hypothetical protein
MAKATFDSLDDLKREIILQAFDEYENTNLYSFYEFTHHTKITDICDLLVQPLPPLLLSDLQLEAYVVKQKVEQAEIINQAFVDNLFSEKHGRDINTSTVPQAGSRCDDCVRNQKSLNYCVKRHYISQRLKRRS